MVCTPLAVEVELKLPQGPLEQDQLTVAFAGALAIVAARLAVLPGATMFSGEVGGAEPDVKERIIFELIVILAEMNTELLLADVAITVTVPPEGTTVGAVYVV